MNPPPVNGIHTWIMEAAWICRVKGMDALATEQAIRSYESQLRRPFHRREVEDAVEKVFACSMEERDPTPRQPKRAWKPMSTRQATIKERVTVADLWHASPMVPDDGLTQTFVLRHLFPDPDGLLCVGKTAYEFRTATLDNLPRLTGWQFIVPCYMSKKVGVTQDGKPSQHCLDNCGDRRFLVCDFDEPSSDQHPSILWTMRTLWNLVLVVSSGGKSLHGWFAEPEDRHEEFWKAAIPLGADPALMRNRSSFVRLPLGTRDNGKRQKVVFFDPWACGIDSEHRTA